jgi:Fe-S cluster biogenesis protein NfuA
MNEPMTSGEFQAHAEQVERMVQRVSALKDEDARTTSLELLQSVMDFHGAVLSRIVEVLAGSGESGRNSLAKLGSDPLVCGLLVLYGIHPVALQERVARAVEKVRPQLSKQGGNVELVGVTDLTVRVKIESSGHGCGSAPEKLKAIVEQAILEAAPETVAVVADIPAGATFVPLSHIQPAILEEKKYEESTT